MKKSVVLGAVLAGAALLAAGWSMAETSGHAMGHGAIHGEDHGHGMSQHVGSGMGHGATGPGMAHGQAAAFTGPFDIDAAKQQLSITSAQQPAWTNYAEAAKQAATRFPGETVDQNTVRDMSPQDRFAFASAMRDERQKLTDDLTAATEELLSTLDPAQQARAKALLPGLAGGSTRTREAGLGATGGMGAMGGFGAIGGHGHDHQNP